MYLLSRAQYAKLIYEQLNETEPEVRSSKWSSQRSKKKKPTLLHLHLNTGDVACHVRPCILSVE